MKHKLEIAGIAVLAFCAGLAVSVFTLPLWVVVVINAAKDGPRTDWLGFAGGLIGNVLTGVIAAIAIVVTWQGIRHQLKISLISREEERIEKTLPGLKTLAGYLENLKRYLSRAKAERAGEHILSFVGYEEPDDSFSFTEKFEETFAMVDAVTRQKLLIIFQTIITAARHVDDEQRRLLQRTERLEAVKTAKNVMAEEVVRADALASQTSLTMKMLVLQTALYDLYEFQLETIATTEVFEDRLRRFRPKLEAYFDER